MAFLISERDVSNLSIRKDRSIFFHANAHEDLVISHESFFTENVEIALPFFLFFRMQNLYGVGRAQDPPYPIVFWIRGNHEYFFFYSHRVICCPR